MLIFDFPSLFLHRLKPYLALLCAFCSFSWLIGGNADNNMCLIHGFSLNEFKNITGRFKILIPQWCQINFRVDSNQIRLWQLQAQLCHLIISTSRQNISIIASSIKSLSHSWSRCYVIDFLCPPLNSMHSTHFIRKLYHDEDDSTSSYLYSRTTTIFDSCKPL